MRSVHLLTAILAVSLLFPAALVAGTRVSPTDPGQDAGTAPSPILLSAEAPMASPATADVLNQNTGLTYGTIAEALADAATLDGHVLEVVVSPHTEGIVNVNKSVTILGGGGGAVILAGASTGSAGDARAWFLISAPDVVFRDLTFDGTGYAVYQAIRSWGDGLLVEHCAFQNIRYDLYHGMAVVGYANTTVTGCTFTNIERIGVFLFGAGVTAGEVSGCTYTGKGAVDGLDYGIELGGGAVASLTGNSITGCTGVAASDGSGSAGVLITTYFGGGTTGILNNNALTGNSVGLYMGYDDADASTVTAFDNDLQEPRPRLAEPDERSGPPTALTMPMVSVLSKPNGLPTAITRSPTWRSDESPSSAIVTGSFVSNEMSAMSRRASLPTTFAGNVRWSFSFTLTSVADSTTWLLVST